MIRKTTYLLATVIACVIGLASGQGQSKSNPAVYVWDFNDRSLQRTELTANFTHDFEVALQQFGSSNYRVIERRQFDRLLGHAENEASIASTSKIPSSVVETLKGQKADQVVFGEVYDDVSSGQVSITVTFEDFTGHKRLIKSTLMSRGTVNDATSRAVAMEKLVKDISSRQTPVMKKESNGLLFEIEKCVQSDKVVTLNLTITNNDDDRNVRIWGDYGGSSSRLYDDQGNEVAADLVKIANKTQKNEVTHLMVSGLPTKCQLVFDGVSIKATSISRLEISYTDLEIEKAYKLIFRNIEIQK